MNPSPTWLAQLQRLHLNRVLSFVAVADAQSFRAAAARLHVSQSALSVQVRELERELGTPLLHRTTRSVALTPEGQRLHAVMQRVGPDLAQVMAELRGEAALQRGVVTVAVLPSLAAPLLARAMRSFALRYPGISIRPKDVDSQRATQMVRQGEVDMGLLSLSEAAHDLCFEPLLRDELVALVPAQGHALSARSRLRLADLAAHPLLLNPRGVALRELLESLFRREGLSPQPAQEMVGAHALMAMVGLGFGVSVLPRLALCGSDLSLCRVVALQPQAAREIGIVSVRGRSPSPARAAFGAFLQAQAGAIQEAVAAARPQPGRRVDARSTI